VQNVTILPLDAVAVNTEPAALCRLTVLHLNHLVKKSTRKTHIFFTFTLRVKILYRFTDHFVEISKMVATKKWRLSQAAIIYKHY
jgi:hypothetical protein